jgi:hypothetical protein
MWPQHIPILKSKGKEIIYPYTNKEWKHGKKEEREREKYIFHENREIAILTMKKKPQG